MNWLIIIISSSSPKLNGIFFNWSSVTWYLPSPDNPRQLSLIIYQFVSISKRMSKSKIFLPFAENVAHLIKLTVNLVYSHIETKCNHHLLWAIFICFHLQIYTMAWRDTHTYSHLINSLKQSKHRNNPQRVLYVIAFCHIFSISISVFSFRCCCSFSSSFRFSIFICYYYFDSFSSATVPNWLSARIYGYKKSAQNTQM